VNDAAIGQLPARLTAVAETAALASVTQPAMASSAERWIASSPEFEEEFRALPDFLDRTSVRAFCEGRSRDGDGLVSIFIASQVWGHGGTGYGPHRLSQALAHPDLVPALQCAADELDDGRPAEAFEALCVVFRLPWVGTAFGTKFLFFADRQRRALILDRLVAQCLRANTGRRFNLDRHSRDYRGSSSRGGGRKSSMPHPRRSSC
jgi:hypothetical protein